MIIEVSLNNNSAVRVRCWLITCGLVLCICTKIHFKIKVPFNFHHTSNKLPLCPGRLFVSEPGICRQLAPLPPRLRLRHYRRFRARRPGGQMWELRSFRASFSGHIRHPTPEVGMGRMGQAGIKTCCLYMCLVFLSSVILLTSFTIQWILYSIQFSLVSITILHL